jgi:hypothetical protein
MNKEGLQKLIAEVLKELQNEMTTTGAVAGYQTPNAFSPNKKSKGNKSAAEATSGYTAVKEDEDPDVLSEARGRYFNFRESSEFKNPGSKVSFCIREMKKMMAEVEFLVKINKRLKTEAGVSNDMLWKRTALDIQAIQERMKNVSQGLKELTR